MRSELLTAVASTCRQRWLEFTVKNRQKVKAIKNGIKNILVKGDDFREKSYVERTVCETANGDEKETHMGQANKRKKMVYPRGLRERS